MIKQMFCELNPAEQQELLQELNMVPKLVSIVSFSQKHQKKFGTNIEFENITHLGTPTYIESTVVTFYGRFTGDGSNQKIAKLNAVLNAEEKWNEIIKD